MARVKGQIQKKAGQGGTAVEREIPLACADEKTAVEMLEAMRWGGEAACPHCGAVGESYQMKDRKTGERSKRWLWRCRPCGEQYTVRVGTVMEHSRLPAKIWIHAIWRACSSKKGVGALQIARETGVSYPTALHLMHRVREAMSDRVAADPPLSGTVEIDEVYIGGKFRGPKNGDHGFGRKRPHKAVTIGILERGGRVKLTHVPPATKAHVYANIRKHVDIPNSRLMTDDSNLYKYIGKEFGGGHHSVNHKRGEYSRKPDITTNGVESVFGLLQRAIYGQYHHVSEKHLHRYLAEREFVFNTRDLTDGERFTKAVKATGGKRLKYRAQVGRA